MRRWTAITLAALFLVIVVTAIAQLSVEVPDTPFAGPTRPGQLPSLSPTPTASP